ncbi:unnamed protein product, partial [Sphacelaria rigidula]
MSAIVWGYNLERWQTDNKVLERIKHKLMGRFFMTGMGDVPLVLGMEAVRDRNSKIVNTSHTNYNKSLQERYEIANNPACPSGTGQALSLDQPRDK